MSLDGTLGPLLFGDISTVLQVFLWDLVENFLGEVVGKDCFEVRV